MAGFSTGLSERDMRFREQSLNAPVWRVVLSVGAPLALYQSLQQLFSILDTLMASHIGAESVSAVAYLTQLLSILAAGGTGLSVGAGIQISRSFGEGDYAMVRKRVSTLYALSALLGLLLLLLILPVLKPFLRLSGTPEELIRVGAPYFAVQLLTTVVSFLNNVYIAVERARGNSGRILRLNLGMICVKISLTAVFVYVLGSGLLMVGVASLLSNLLLLLFAMRSSLFGNDAFSFSLRAVSTEGDVNLPMIEKSIPLVLEKALFSGGKAIVNAMSTMYGELMVGAMGVSNNLGAITTNPQGGFQDGAAAIIGQNYGAGKRDRVLKAFYATCVINVVLGLLISGIELWQLERLSSLFDGGNPEFRRMIRMIYRYEALGAAPLGILSGVLAFLHGTGQTYLSLLLNFSRIFLFRIPVYWFLNHCTALGERSSGLVMIISNLGVSVFAAVLGFFAIWKFRREGQRQIAIQRDLR